MSYKKYANYMFILKLCPDKVINTPNNLFKKSNLIKIESLLNNIIL